MIARKRSFHFLMIALIVLTLQACSVMPQTEGVGNSHHVAQGSPNGRIRIITPELIESLRLSNVRDDIGCAAGLCPEQWNYLIGPGDVLSVTVWDHPQLTMPSGPSAETGRHVDGDGTIFYPYIGRLDVQNRTTAEVRELISSRLKKVIPDPQVDVAVARFRNNNRVYVMGEVRAPGPLELGNGRVSLTDALAKAGGIEKNFANARGIFVFRMASNSPQVDIYQLDAVSPLAFSWGTRFNLQSQDVVYVTSAPAARWGRLISKIIPSLSALNTMLILEDRL